MTKAAPIKARLPRGFADRGAADLSGMRGMLEAIQRTFELYGFEALETPFVEFTDALGKFLPDQDRPNEGVFSFQDDDEQWLSLRYDLTAPLARHVAERLDAQTLPLPYRSYRQGWVFRNEKPGPGRFRQFMQFDADIVGAASVAADAEACMLMADTLERVGIPRGQYVVRVNNRKVLDGVMEAIGLGGEEHAGRRLTVLRAVDKLDRLGVEGVRQLLGEGRKDESGAFTKGAGLTDEQTDRISLLVEPHAPSLNRPGSRYADPTPIPSKYSSTGEAPSNFELVQRLRNEFAENELAKSAFDELEEIVELAGTCGYGWDRIRYDSSVVRGLEYYTGTVFEAELTFPTVNEAGETVRFGSVAGGGRYDGLVGRFRPEPVPATGFSIGVSRLHAALKIVGSPIVSAQREVGPVVVLVLDRDRVADYQAMVTELREAGVAAELYLGSAGMKAQMKYADRRGAPCVVIQGSQERDRGEVQIKDLSEGAERARSDATGISNADYRSARLAQVSVPRSELAAKVKDVRDRLRM